MRKMYPADRGPLSDVPNSGPAPVLMRWNELFKVHILGVAALCGYLLFASRLVSRCARPWRLGSPKLWGIKY